MSDSPAAANPGARRATDEMRRPAVPGRELEPRPALLRGRRSQRL